MRPTDSTRYDWRGVTLALALALSGGCGEVSFSEPGRSDGFGLNYIGFPCDPGGAQFDLTGTYERPLDLSVNEVQVVTAVLKGPVNSCPYGSQFVRLEWIADFTSPGQYLRARLIGCEACTVLFQAQPPQYGQFAVKGAAVLHRSQQRLAFEVTGIAPGVGDLELLACTDENCTQAADAHLVFRVADP